MVEMHLAAVRVEMATSTPILLLQEVGEGNRTLPIYIGQAEAQSIAQELQEIVAPRPMTHDLMRDLLADLGATVDCVVITDLREGTFYAEIRMTLNGTRHAVSARPSDAVALAVRTHSTIYAEDDLLDAEGVILHEAGDEEEAAAEADELVSQFKEFIDGIKPEDFER
jgi:bifunctional DNase/RNase